MKKSASDYVILGLKGFCMGASDVIPGVSGGTMAFILGIYDELIAAIRTFDLKSLKSLLQGRFGHLFNYLAWDFLLVLGVGILTAVFTLARWLGWLLENEPVLIWSFFMGLILASVLSVSRRVTAWHPAVWSALGAVSYTHLTLPTN